MRSVLDTPIRTTAGTLDRALATRHPVLVVFETPGCGPCQSLAPRLEQAAQAYVDRVRVIRVEDANEADMARRFGVTAVPTLVFRRNGKEVARIEGAASLEALRGHLDYLVGEAPRPARAKGPCLPLVDARVDDGEPEPDRVVPAGDATFERLVLESPLPVLVEFWAEWCYPCQMMAPVLDALARDYAGRLRLVQVDTDANPSTCGVYGILGIPTFILFSRGRPVYRGTGAVARASLDQAIEAALKAA